MERQREIVRVKIVHEWEKNKQISYSVIAKICKTTKSNVCKTINRFLNEGTIKSKPKSGRPRGTRNKKLKLNVLKTLKNTPSKSVRDIAKKHGTTKDMVQRIKKNNGLKTYKKQKIPKRSKKQTNVAVTRAKLLYKHLVNTSPSCLIMDDETYLKMDFSTLPGPQYYTTEPGEVLDESITAIRQEKFGEKLLVWQAICQCGFKSTPFFTKSTINTDNYIQECLKKRLLPLVRKHNNSTLFWPDLASAHYAKRTLEWLAVNNVNFVRKEMNPPNTPELRPIERFWAIMKRNLRNDGRTVKSVEELKTIYQSTQRKMDGNAVRALMANIKGKIREFQRHPLLH